MTIANDLTEEQYGFSPAAGSRTAGQILTHIALGSKFQEMVHMEKRNNFDGMDFPALFASMAAEEQKSRTKAEIVASLKENSDRFANWLETVSDDFLAEPVGMPAGASPASKTRFEMLMGVKEHEMHHRGQLMLIQRMLGGTPHLTRQMTERMEAMRQK